MIKGAAALAEWFERQAGNFATAVQRAPESPETQTWVYANAQTIWNSEGAAIQEDWNGRTLVRTGLLRASASSATVTLAGSRITLTHGPFYAQFVANRYTFSGLSRMLPSGETLGDVILNNATVDWSSP